MSTNWNWPTRDRKFFWEKVRTIATEYGEPIVRILEVPGAFDPGISKALEKLKSLFPSDLTISELDNPEVLQSLDGAPGPFVSEDGKSPVFINGLNASITIAHNNKGQETIQLERLDIQLLNYQKPPFPAYEAKFDATKIFGAGFIEPLRFYASVSSTGPNRASRAIKDPKGKTKMVLAQSSNFLDTDPASFLDIGPKDGSTRFLFNITAKDPGLYNLCLRWFYRVAARELRQHTSLPIIIYKGE